MAKFNKDSRKKRIKELIRMSEKGLEVSKRDFDIAVEKDFAKLYKQRWAEQIELRKMEAPSEVKEYEQILQEALMVYGRCEQFSVQKTGKMDTVQSRQKVLEELSSKADSLFEDAMSRLEEILTVDQSLRIWFDRDIDFSVGNNHSFEPEGMPRVVTSKSDANLAKYDGMKRFGWQSKAEVRLGVLRDKLVDLESKEITAEDIELEIERNNQQSAKLKSLLATIKKQR